jgi:hypothetical protein
MQNFQILAVDAVPPEPTKRDQIAQPRDQWLSHHAAKQKNSRLDE